MMNYRFSFKTNSSPRFQVKFICVSEDVFRS